MAVDTDFEHELHRRTPPPPAGSLFEAFADKVMRRTDEVLAGRGCPWPPSTQEQRFLSLLRNHQGKARAVSVGEFCERMNLTPRQAKDLVQELRQSFGVQIGASRDSDNGGYYLIATAEESFESTAQMFRQAITMLRVVRRMRGEAETVEQMLTQIELGLADWRGNPK